MTKKISLIAAGLLGLAGMAHASVTIDLDAGVLSTSTGTPLTTGLLQLIAYNSTTGTFAAPTATSFVGGDTANEEVLLSFTFKQGGSGYVTGETASNNLMFSYSGNFVQGDELLLRWYPTLTTASTAPGAGTTYGQYRSNTNTNDGGSGIAWYGPADGTYTVPGGLNFLTATAGGLNPDTAGRASLTVAAAPEPSTYAMVGLAALGLAGMKFRRRNA